MTLEQETAITILAPALAIPPASDFDPTYKSIQKRNTKNQHKFKFKARGSKEIFGWDGEVCSQDIP